MYNSEGARSSNGNHNEATVKPLQYLQRMYGGGNDDDQGTTPVLTDAPPNSRDASILPPPDQPYVEMPIVTEYSDPNLPISQLQLVARGRPVHRTINKTRSGPRTVHHNQGHDDKEPDPAVPRERSKSRDQDISMSSTEMRERSRSRDDPHTSNMEAEDQGDPFDHPRFPAEKGQGLGMTINLCQV